MDTISSATIIYSLVKKIFGLDYLQVQVRMLFVLVVFFKSLFEYLAYVDENAPLSPILFILRSIL